MNVLLNAHSYYSLLKSPVSPKNLVKAAARNGFHCLALTDYNLLTGAVEFTIACREANLQPILGLEIDFLSKPHGHQTRRLILLVENETGWRNICKLSTLNQLKEQSISIDHLARYSAGLICLVGMIEEKSTTKSPLDDELVILSQLTEFFLGSLFLKLDFLNRKQTRQTDIFIHLAEKMSLPLVAAPAIYYLKETQSKLFSGLQAIKNNQTIASVEKENLYTTQKLLPQWEDFEHHYKELPQSIKATQTIAERCQFQLTLGVSRPPIIPLPNNKTPSQELREKAYSGAQKTYGQITKELTERLDYELGVINQSGYESVFLIMEEALSFAQKNGILFSSRGSAASSLVAHCLGITSPDPIRLGLYFERFLNPARTTPPDIDTDLDSRRRDELIQHIFDTYGEDRVAMVATINRYRPRSAIADIAKAFALSSAEIRRLSQDLPYSYNAMHASDSTQDYETSLFQNLEAKHPNPKYHLIFKLAHALIGIPRHLSVHPGGVIISPEPMTDLVPVMRSGTKGVIITQFDLDSLEHLGLVKIDLLGIRGLTVLSDVASTIHSWRQIDYPSPAAVLNSVPSQDEKTAGITSSGKTIGCFQIESPGMRATLQQIQARSPDDIMAALALYRPGPLRGGMHDAFIRRHNQEEPAEQIHPALTQTLSDTYGVILYQEQVLRIANHIAGLSLIESDLLRRAMSHFDPGKQMQQLKEKFIQGAKQISHIDFDIAEKIWEMMAAFAGYGFPKAHAASYAQVAWRSAWCKAHFPAEFIGAVLANWGGYYSQRVYLMEARRLGFPIKPPHINHSNREFTVKYPSGEPVLYMGLNQVRDLTTRSIDRILKRRPFNSLENFMFQVDPRLGEAQNLILCGALEGLGTIPELLHNLKNQPGQPTLFNLSPQPVRPDFTSMVRARHQETILGISVDVHPLECCIAQIKAAGAISTVEAISAIGQTVVVAGIRQTHHRSRTTSGESMAFMTIEDLDGILDVVLFPDTYKRTPRAVFSGSNPFIIEGVIERNSSTQDPVLRASRVELLIGDTET
jgi:DNA-directed DNA polymerase III PolC